MSRQSAALTTKLTPEEKVRFLENTERLGTSPSNALRMFVSAFNARGTFPFDLGYPSLRFDRNDSQIVRPGGEGQAPILPAEWDDAGDDVYAADFAVN